MNPWGWGWAPRKLPECDRIQPFSESAQPQKGALGSSLRGKLTLFPWHEHSHIYTQGQFIVHFWSCLKWEHEKRNDTKQPPKEYLWVVAGLLGQWNNTVSTKINMGIRLREWRKEAGAWCGEKGRPKYGTVTPVGSEAQEGSSSDTGQLTCSEPRMLGFLEGIKLWSLGGLDHLGQNITVWAA